MLHCRPLPVVRACGLSTNAADLCWPLRYMVLRWWLAASSGDAVTTVSPDGLLRVALAYDDAGFRVVPRAGVAVRTLAQCTRVDLVE
jgi:hypothetical protein